ncbi:MAG: primase [Parcubacteria group bacterium]|nr:primase [Parcubacteria group bacterium]
MQLSELADTSSGVPLFDWSIQYPKGKKRLIAHPNVAMRRVHTRLLGYLQDIPDINFVLFSSFGALSGRSGKDNAAWHIENRYFYQLDVREAYANVSLTKLVHALHALDTRLTHPASTLKFLKTHCASKDGGLAVGAPCSPALFDLYCAHEIDSRIRNLIDMPRTVYTRYLDDLTISSMDPIPHILRKRIRDVVSAAGFSINRRKSFVKDRCKSSITITGVVLTPKGYMGPTVEQSQKLATLLAGAITTPEEAHSFLGLVSHVRSIGRTRSSRTKVSPNFKVLLHECALRIFKLQDEGLLPKRWARESNRLSIEFVDGVRKYAPLVAVIASYCSLTQRGREYVCLSPFTKEKTPSFFVVPEKSFWHCFSSGRHGDVIDFVQFAERVSFRQAVLKLARDYDIEIPKN